MNDNTKNYIQYYEAQSGGQIPIFIGERGLNNVKQKGAGIGDILKGMFRNILPIAAKGATTFLAETLKAKNEGNHNWKTAMKSALKPTARNIVANTASTLDSKLANNISSHTGHGRRYHKKLKRKHPSSKIPNVGGEIVKKAKLSLEGLHQIGGRKQKAKTGIRRKRSIKYRKQKRSKKSLKHYKKRKMIKKHAKINFLNF